MPESPACTIQGEHCNQTKLQVDGLDGERRDFIQFKKVGDNLNKKKKKSELT